jgi:ketosteroid isomerase-like protein
MLNADPGRESGATLTPEDRLAIEAVHTEWLHAELRQDAPALLELCTATPLWLPPGQEPIWGRPAILAWLQGQPRARLGGIEIDGLSIQGTASFAWKQANFRTLVHGEDGTASAVVTGSHGWLLVRNDRGAWRVAVVTWTTLYLNSEP